MEKSFLYTFLLIITIPLSLCASTSISTLNCAHHELCQMAKEIAIDNKVESHFKFINLVNISGDPHEYEPSSIEIKQLINAPLLLTGPSELNPWAKKINYQRSKNGALKTIGLSFSPQDFKLYPKANSEILSHFWLYPKLYCEMKKRLTLELQNITGHSNFKFICSTEEIENILRETLSSIKIPIILTHDALQPLLSELASNKNLILAIKGSGHHEEASPISIKKMYEAIKAPKVIWIIETGINVPDNILNKMRKSDKVINIDTAQSKDNKYFSILNELENKLKATSGK